MSETKLIFFSLFSDGPTPLGGGLRGEGSGCLPPPWILSDMDEMSQPGAYTTKRSACHFYFVIFYNCFRSHRLVSSSGQQVSSSELAAAASIQAQLMKTMPEVSQWLYIVYRLTSSLVIIQPLFKCLEILSIR